MIKDQDPPKPPSVRQPARPTNRTHTRPAAGCTKQVSPKYLMCAHHWTMVPAFLQLAINRTWEGQSRKEWKENVLKAVLIVAKKEGKEAGE